MTFYQELEHMYIPVSENQRIDTLQFITASAESIIPLLDKLGSTAFSMVKVDINGNLKRVRHRYEEDNVKYATLADIIEVEVKDKTAFKSNSTTEALLWLNRGLNFVCTFLKNLLEGNIKDDSLTPSLHAAYDVTLKKYHNWFLQKTVTMAFLAAPYYSVLIKKMAIEGETEENINKGLEEYQVLLQGQVTTITELFIANGLDPIK